MRHRKAGVKLNRTTSHRQAMFRNMVTSLFKHDRVRTTDAKAKELRRWADHIITLAKRGDLHARRQVLSIMREKEVVHKLFEEAEKRFGKMNGGYTRIVKIGPRPGDAAPISLIELISIEEKPKGKKSKRKSAATSKKRARPTAKTSAKKETRPPDQEEEGPVESPSAEPPPVAETPETAPQKPAKATAGTKRKRTPKTATPKKNTKKETSDDAQASAAEETDPKA